MKTILSLITIVILFIAFSCNDAIIAEQSTEPYAKDFKQAKAVWKVGDQYVMNQTLGFRGVIIANSQKKPTILRLTGSSLYRVFLNGEFVGHGPARAGHNYYRVDELDLTQKLKTGENILAIEVAGYNVNSYYLLDQPSFLQAEVTVDGKVKLATLPDNNKLAFELSEVKERYQKVARYSFQRTFAERYKLTPTSYKWLNDLSAPFEKVACEAAGDKNLLVRRVNYSKFEIIHPNSSVSSGKVKREGKKEKYWKARFVNQIHDQFKGFKEDDLTLYPLEDIQDMKTLSKIDKVKAYDKSNPVKLQNGDFKILRFDYNATGFIGATINCKKAGRFYFIFEELLTDDDVLFYRNSTNNSVTYDLTPGVYHIETIEPYTFKYLKVIMEDGECELSNVHMREYTNPDIYDTKFACSDKRINNIFAAGMQNFRQNVVDIPMDCPSRERAGWLCDSYFSSRAEKDITGQNLVETNFLEIFWLTSGFDSLPEGMIGMCYPADHSNGNFIPNWSMFFVIELEDYLFRTKDKELVEALKPRVMGIIDYFKKFMNEDGLLESLEKWVMVEYSSANDFVQDVNYPSNMVYTDVLRAAANMYNMPELAKQAADMQKTIIEQSFNGEFFVDNAVRENEKLVITNNVSEACQYFALYFLDGDTKKEFTRLWNNLVTVFGPKRVENNPYPNIDFVNAFIGTPLRLELLAQDERIAQLLDESVDYYNYMAELTGTLWEHKSHNRSCNHGFASHIVHVLYRDVLGISADNDEKLIKVKFSNLDLSFCKGQMPVGDKIVSLEWEKKNGAIVYKLQLPEGYKANIVNYSGLKLVQKE